MSDSATHKIIEGGPYLMCEIRTALGFTLLIILTWLIVAYSIRCNRY